MDGQDRALVEAGLGAYAYRVMQMVLPAILGFQLLMMALTLAKPGGPMATPRRTVYWWMYVALFGASLLALLAGLRLHRAGRDRTLLCLTPVYAAFVCLWGCGITLNDQLGGNGVGVFNYVLLSIAAFSVLKPWQSVALFGSSFLVLNALLPLFPGGLHNLFSNALNTLCTAGLSILISVVFYRSKVKGLCDEIIIRRQFDEIQKINERLEYLAVTDELTGLYNRRYLERFARGETMAGHSQVAGLMVDIDYFKQYNDAYGHLKGDACLTQIGQLIQQAAGQWGGCAVRYGGEEFFVCLPGCAEDQALEQAETLRTGVLARGLERDDLPEGRVSVSIGVCALTDWTPAGLEELLRRADRALYRAKERGRNQSAVYRAE